MSGVYESLGRLEEALPLAEESLALQRRLWAGVDGVHSHVARGLNNLSQVYQAMGRLEDALPPAEECLAAQRRSRAGVGRAHIRYAGGLKNAADTYPSRHVHGHADTMRQWCREL